MKSILVTGAAGFIGSHLTERLLADGYRVVGLDNFNDFYDPTIKEANVAPLVGNTAFHLVRGDIRDRALLDRLFAEERFAGVIHLAAMAGVRPSIADPALYQQVNLEGTVTLLELCRRHDLRRFIFASSSSVYGARRNAPFRESDPVDDPVSPYAATKKAGELLCYTYHHLFGMDISCLRFFTVYGPRQRPEMAIHLFAQRIAAGEPIPLFGDGTSSRDYTYIDDIVNGIVAAYERANGYRIYNLGESTTVTLSRLVELLEESLGTKARIERFPDQPGDVPLTYADITRAREELDYRPQVPVEEGIKRFVEWFNHRT